MPLYAGEVAMGGTLANGEATLGARLNGPFLFALSGTWVGTVAVQSSLDEGATWLNCTMPDGTDNGWTRNGVYAVPFAMGKAVLYRLAATLSSGSVGWRIAQ